ncbi:MAG: hypothetical protein ACT4OY_05290 [Alphaproteobacteria bacterium]
MSQPKYDYTNLFNVLSSASINFEDVKRELRPVLKANLESKEIIGVINHTAGKITDISQKRDLGQWVWGYVGSEWVINNAKDRDEAETQEIETAAIRIVFDTIDDLPEEQKFETAKWVCQKAKDNNEELFISAATKRLALIDSLPPEQQYEESYELWLVIAKDHELEEKVLEKAFNSISKLPEEKHLGAIKWVLSHLSENHDFYPSIFEKALELLDILPASEVFEEAQWLAAHTQDKKLKPQALEKAFKGVANISSMEYEAGTQWLLDQKPKAPLRKSIEKFMKQHGINEAMGFEAFAEKINTPEAK